MDRDAMPPSYVRAYVLRRLRECETVADLDVFWLSEIGSELKKNRWVEAEYRAARKRLDDAR